MGSINTLKELGFNKQQIIDELIKTYEISNKEATELVNKTND